MPVPRWLITVLLLIGFSTFMGSCRPHRARLPRRALHRPQLKIIQEAVTLAVSILFLRDKPRRSDHAAFLLISAAVGVSMIGRERIIHAPATHQKPVPGAPAPHTSPTHAESSESLG